jgi:hypothetical protein
LSHTLPFLLNLLACNSSTQTFRGSDTFFWLKTRKFKAVEHKGEIFTAPMPFSDFLGREDPVHLSNDYKMRRRFAPATRKTKQNKF